MLVFIIAAQTMDGFIAKKENESSMSWTSKSDKAFFINRTKEAGVCIMGRKTYETIGKPLAQRRTIVMSRSKKFDNVETTSESPEDIIERLQREGVKEVAIAGGSSVYTSFIESNLVNKMYITIEGCLFGEGISIFNKKVDKKLELVENSKIGDNTILLEYNVIK